MSSPFFESSKKIANDFLQSIVFIDDRAFVKEGPNHHDFDTQQITRVFAKSRKICAVYNPETLSDIDHLAILAKKSDITVLDWQINLKEEESENGEEDAKEDDPRGPHTRRIIREILSDPLTGKGSLKLILIYTGEIDLPGITDEIFNDLESLTIEGLQKGDCSVFTENIKIFVVAKASSDDASNEPKFKHNPELNNKVVAYNDLPDFILTKFTEMTAGLLTNFVLQSLAAIRANTFRLIKLYKKELDPSFLAHRFLLPNPEDSKEHLVEILSGSIQALLNYNEVGEAASLENIIHWIDTREFTYTLSISNKDLQIDSVFVQEWATKGFVEACKAKWIILGYGDLSESQIKKFEDKQRELYKHGSSLIRMDVESENIDGEFSILTHHKSNLKQISTIPKLSLGTIIREEIEDQNGRYFLCIQAKCDSVRVSSLRKFLFIRLEEIDGNSKFNFVVENGNRLVKLRIMKETFELRTIKFDPSLDNQVVLAEESGGQYIFTSNHNERFQWLADLKDAHAQREANNFAAKISRVGLDESEWLRRWAP